MAHMVQVSGYNTSRDYEQLAELMPRQSVICIVDYRSGDFKCRDVGHTLWSQSGEETSWQISARGIGYVYGFTRAQFIEQCVDQNVEWLVPATE